jgi:hypothetical protein
VPQNANRCPHCWAALAEHVTDFCPFCRGSLAVKERGRRGSDAPKANPVTPPPPPPQPAAPYEPYPPYEPVAAAAAAATAVAVLERDPIEFPGTPLPQDFFDALPERARKPKSKWSAGRIIGIVTVVAIGIVSGVLSEDRNAKSSSPARQMVAGPCAEYRDFTSRSDREGFQQAMLWFQNNVATFAAAAKVDPDLRDAAEVVAWFDNAIKANFAPMGAMSSEDLQAKEEPLARACYLGPGRA